MAQRHEARFADRGLRDLEGGVDARPHPLDQLGAGQVLTERKAAGVPEDVVRRSVENSLVFGVYRGEEQVGFARVVTDYATFAYLADVFVLEAHRGRGVGKWLIEVVLSHPDLRGLRRWMLATGDAHELYRKYGFAELARAEIFMEIHSPYR